MKRGVGLLTGPLPRPMSRSRKTKQVKKDGPGSSWRRCTGGRPYRGWRSPRASVASTSRRAGCSCRHPGMHSHTEYLPREHVLHTNQGVDGGITEVIIIIGQVTTTRPCRPPRCLSVSCHPPGFRLAAVAGAFPPEPLEPVERCLVDDRRLDCLSEKGGLPSRRRGVVVTTPEALPQVLTGQGSSLHLARRAGRGFGLCCSVKTAASLRMKLT